MGVGQLGPLLELRRPHQAPHLAQASGDPTGVMALDRLDERQVGGEFVDLDPGRALVGVVGHGSILVRPGGPGRGVVVAPTVPGRAAPRCQTADMASPRDTAIVAGTARFGVGGEVPPPGDTGGASGPSPTAVDTGDPLRRLYELPETPLSSGTERARLQAAMLADRAAAAGRPLLVVDLGCGDGVCAAVALEVCSSRQAPVRFVGLDWSLAALRQAQERGIAVTRASVDGPGLPLADASVDVVVMSELIEHLVDPDRALDEVRRVLVPGGTLLLSTPNLAAWFNRGLLAFGIQPLFTEVSLRGIYGRPGHQVVGHLRLFTRRALAGLLVASGFVDVDIAGAPYHDVPKPLRPLDRLLCRTPGLSSILLASARTPDPEPTAAAGNGRA